MRLSMTLRSHLVWLLEDESGQDLIEYALIFSLLGLAAVASLRGVGTRVAASLTYISTTLNSSI